MEPLESSASVIVQLPGQPDTDYALSKAITLVGREAMNDLVVNDAEVSRRHCRILRDRDGHLIEDLGSTNGTFVNGQRVLSSMSLYHSDVIELGKSARLTYLGSSTKPQPIISRPHQPETKTDDTPTNMPAVAPVEVADQSVDPAYVDPADQTFAPEAPAYRFEEEEDESRLIRPQIEPERPNWFRRITIGFGCLTLLGLITLIGLLFYFDANYPELLYCGRFENIWVTVLNPFLNILGRPLDCSVFQ